MTDPADYPADHAACDKSSLTVGDCMTLTQHFLGERRMQQAFAEEAVIDGRRVDPAAPADSDFIAYTERVLSGVIGSNSARELMASAVSGTGMPFSQVVDLLNRTSQSLRLRQDLLHLAMENLSDGLSVIDAKLRLVAWNQRYLELFDYPEGLIHIGRPIEEVLMFNAKRGQLGEGDPQVLVARRLQWLKQGSPHFFERLSPDGRVIEIRGNPMPGGGFVTSFTDITKRKMAERANRSKTSFLAAASHDLLQPLNAARLFASALSQQADLGPEPQHLVARLDGSLRSTEQLLSALLDISRLDAGVLPLTLTAFPLDDVLAPLAAEFAALAAERGLKFDCLPTRLWVRSDAKLLRRVLQNLLSNALRYTRSGRVLIGVRRRSEAQQLAEIQVLDTGPGIPHDQTEAIFAEFHRLQDSDTGAGRGLGLGLAIVERICKRLDHPIRLQSQVGRGTLMSVGVPRASAQASASTDPATKRVRTSGDLSGLRVLCVDNEPDILFGMQTLLTPWGCRVTCAGSETEVQSALARLDDAPDVMLVDYHLGDSTNGLDLMNQLRAKHGQKLVGILITADQRPEVHQNAKAQHYRVLAKPLKPAALRALLSRIARLVEVKQ